MKPTLFALAALTLTTGAAAAQETTLWRLDCGSIEVRDMNLFSDTGAYPQGEAITLTNSCYVIRHGDDVLLWDAGFPEALKGAPLDPAAPLAPTLERTVTEQLGEIGLSAGDVTMVGVSHYHFDHTGQASAFPQAELLIGAADWAVLSADPFPAGVVPFVDPRTVAPWLVEGANVRAVTGDHDVFGDGSVTMLAMPGHTPGEMALLVQLAETGPVLLSGDVVHFAEQMETQSVPPFNHDRADTLASTARMEALADNLGATLVIQHDARHVALLPAFPEAAR